MVVLAEALDDLPDKVMPVVLVGAEKAQRFHKNAPAQQPKSSSVMDMPGDPIVPRKGTEFRASLWRILVVEDISEARPVPQVPRRAMDGTTVVDGDRARPDWTQFGGGAVKLPTALDGIGLPGAAIESMPQNS